MTSLSDTHYRIAARYNLGLAPPGVPSDCQGCKEKNKLNTDSYHYLSCTRHKRQEITIGHNMLVHVVYTYNNYTGIIITAKQHDAKFVPFIMEATGGMSKSAKQIYEMIILASRDNGTLWPHDIIARDFRGAIAIAVQRRNAMTMIAGRCLAIGRAATCAAA